MFRPMSSLYILRCVVPVFLAVFLLPCCGAEVAAQALPWTESRLLHNDSIPQLANESTLRLATGDDRFASLAQDGVSTFVLHDGRWQAGPSAAMLHGMALAWVDDSVLVLGREGLLVLAPDGDITIIAELACPSGSYGALGELPGTGTAVVMIGGRIFLVTAATGHFERVAGADLPNDSIFMASCRQTGQLFAYGSNRLRVWDPQVQRFTAWTDADGQEITAPAKSLVIDSAGRRLYAGTAGEGLLVIDLPERRVYATNPETMPNVARQHIFPVALDTERDVLYVPSWTHVIAVAPASDPAAWREVGYLNAMTTPALHTYRAVATVAGLVYLPQTDHLIFGGKWGLDVLAAPGSGRFIEDDGFARFTLAAEDIHGEGVVYDRIRQQRLRAVYVNSGRATAESFELFARAGINAVFYQVYFIEHGEFYPPFDVREHLAQVAQWCEAADIMLFIAARQVGWSHFNHQRIRDYRYRHFVTPSGQIGAYKEKRDVPGYDRAEFPCHFDEGYWELSLGYQIEEFGQIAAELPVAGFILEMGDAYSGANISHAFDPCMCDDCWERFFDHDESADPQGRALAVDGWNRFHWLHSRDLWQAFLDFQQERFTALARTYLHKARAHQPALVTALALPEMSNHYEESWYYRAWIDGLVTPAQPVLVCSQQTYGTPFSPVMAIKPGQRLSALGLHLLFIPGLATIWHTPDELARRTADNLHHTPGTWYYHGNHWHDEHLQENHYTPLIPGVERRFTVPQYVEALGEVRAP